jgi:predicted transcriptional regulator
LGREVQLGMGPAKAQMIRLIEDQPDDSSIEEILRELAFAAMVERGVADSDAGRTISNEEMARRMESWRK